MNYFDAYKRQKFTVHTDLSLLIIIHEPISNGQFILITYAYEVIYISFSVLQHRVSRYRLRPCSLLRPCHI